MGVDKRKTAEVSFRPPIRTTRAQISERARTPPPAFLFLQSTLSKSHRNAARRPRPELLMEPNAPSGVNAAEAYRPVIFPGASPASLKEVAARTQQNRRQSSLPAQPLLDTYSIREGQASDAKILQKFRHLHLSESIHALDGPEFAARERLKRLPHRRFLTNWSHSCLIARASSR